MSRTEFDEFVKRQQREESSASKVDWDAERDQWLESLNALYAQIEKFLQAYISAGQARYEYRDVALNEQDLGSYVAREMILHFGRQQVKLIPIGAMLIGTKGRVDVNGPAGTARLTLIGKDVTDARQLLNVTVTGFGKEKSLRPSVGNRPREPMTRVWKIASRPPEMKFTELTQEAFFEMILEVANA